VTRFSQLSPSRQFLVRLCQATNYGRIEDLVVGGGEPIFSGPAPVVLADVRLDVEEYSRDEHAAADFVLCAEVRRLMAILGKIGDGRISKIEIRAGVPRRITVECPLMSGGEVGRLSDFSAVACREAGRI
jgi:hypothetical protein